jgi:hypothetical protein
MAGIDITISDIMRGLHELFFEPRTGAHCPGC